MRLRTVWVVFSLIILIFVPIVNGQEGGEYHETFDDPDLEGWEIAPEVMFESGVMRIPAPAFAFKFGEYPAVDFSVTARIEDETELLIGYNVGEAGSYQLIIGPGYAALIRDKAGVPHELHEQPVEVRPNEWFVVEVQLEGNEHRISVNDVALSPVSEEEMLVPGGLLLHAMGPGAAEIDELVIRGGDREPSEGTGPPDSPPPDATGDVWVRTGGPLGGLGYDIRMHPDNPDLMYVTDAWAGVFRSFDGGQTWSPSNNGIDVSFGGTSDAIPIFCLTIDPHNADVIWVGTQHRRGIFKSVDGGDNWVRMDNGIVEDEGITFRGITVDPNDSNTVYAAAELASYAWSPVEVIGREFDMTKGVVYRTTDGGQNWTEVWRGDNLARYVLINPQNTDIIYISTGIFDREAGNSDPQNRVPGGEGVIKSTDGGQTWTQVNNGLNNLYVGSLFMQPENPDILLAGTGNNQYYDDSGVYITTDGGQSWQHTLQDINIESVEFALDNPNIAYAGGDARIFRSEDGGFTWTPVSEGEDGWGSPNVRAGFPIDFQVDPQDANRIFANNYGGGNFLSMDGGRTWIVASTGYTGAQVRDIAVDPSNPQHVYAAARSGMFHSQDGGQTWQGLNHRPMQYVLEWYVVAIDPSDPQHVLAANNWTGIMLQSHDGGSSWQTAGEFLGDGKAWRAIAFAPSDPTVVYAGASAFYSAGTLAEDMPSSGVFVSRDGGTQWQPANAGMMQDANVTDLAVHPINPSIVYAATGNHGLLRSDDAGQNWQAVTLAPNAAPVALSVTFNPIEPDTTFVGLQRSGVFRSDDAGVSWQNVGAGLPPESTISDILFHPVNTAVMYLADRQSGVYRSTDGGQTWTTLNTGLLMRDVNALDISADGNQLYAATEGGGVFRLSTQK